MDYHKLMDSGELYGSIDAPISANNGLRNVHFGKNVNFNASFVDDGDLPD